MTPYLSYSQFTHKWYIEYRIGESVGGSLEFDTKEEALRHLYGGEEDEKDF